MERLNQMWRNTDPRYICSDLNRRSMRIVILRPDINGFGAKFSGCGDVYVEDDCWSISTSFKDHTFIRADDNWDEAWQWIEFPENK